MLELNNKSETQYFADKIYFTKDRQKNNFLWLMTKAKKRKGIHKNVITIVGVIVVEYC